MKVFVTGATGAVGRPAVEALVSVGHEVTAVARSAEKTELLRSARRHAGRGRPLRLPGSDRSRPRPRRGGEPGHQDPPDLQSGDEAELGRERAHPARGVGERDRRRPRDRCHPLGAGVDRLRLCRRGAGTSGSTRACPSTYPTAFGAWLTAEANAQRVTEGGKTGVVLRFGNFYGPGAGHSEDWARMARRRLSGTIGDPEGYWSVIHLDDAGSAVVSALDAPAGTYNVVDDEPLAKRELGEVMAEAAGTKSPRQAPKVLQRWWRPGPRSRRAPTGSRTAGSRKPPGGHRAIARSATAGDPLSRP